MTRVLFIGALLAVAFWVYSIVDCAVQPPMRHRGVSKPAWLVIVVLLPVVGGVVWFVIGRTGKAAMVAARRAPDDDPEFLSRIGSISDQDERIRRLEEELAQLDAEAEDPSPTAPSDDSSRGPLPHPQRPSDDEDPRGPRGAIS